MAFRSQQERICKTKQATGAARICSAGRAVPGIRSSPDLLVAAYQGLAHRVHLGSYLHSGLVLQRKSLALLPGKCLWLLPASPHPADTRPPRCGEKLFASFWLFSPFNEKNVFLSRRLSLKNNSAGKKGSRLGDIYLDGAVIDGQRREPALCQPSCREEQGQSRCSQGKPSGGSAPNPRSGQSPFTGC